MTQSGPAGCPRAPRTTRRLRQAPVMEAEMDSPWLPGVCLVSPPPWEPKETESVACFGEGLPVANPLK